MRHMANNKSIAPLLGAISISYEIVNHEILLDNKLIAATLELLTYYAVAIIRQWLTRNS